MRLTPLLFFRGQIVRTGLPFSVVPILVRHPLPLQLTVLSVYDILQSSSLSILEYILWTILHRIFGHLIEYWLQCFALFGKGVFNSDRNFIIDSSLYQPTLFHFFQSRRKYLCVDIFDTEELVEPHLSKMHHVLKYQGSKFLAHYPEGVVDRTQLHIILHPFNSLIF